MLQSLSKHHSICIWLAVSASVVVFCKMKLFLDPSKHFISSSHYSSSQESHYSPISSLRLNKESKYTRTAIPRTDSEFSIGLGRSNSVEKHLQDLGTLCDSGQYFISLTRTTVLSIVLCTGAYLTYKGIVHSSNK